MAQSTTSEKMICFHARKLFGCKKHRASFVDELMYWW